MGQGSQSSSQSPIMAALHRLVRDGWLPLRQMSILLGHAHPTGVYGRQKGPNAIPTVKVGSTLRVYAEDVVHTLETVPDRDREAAVAILTKYRQLLKEQDNGESVRSP